MISAFFSRRIDAKLMNAPDEPQKPTRQGLRLTMLIILIFAALVGLFYAEEDTKGKLAWSNFEHAEQAKGEKFAWSDFVPPTVQDGKNFALTPLLSTAFDYTHSTNGTRWRDTNAWEHLSEINSGAGNARNKAPGIGDPEQGELADLNAAAAFYRGNTNYPQCAVRGNSAEVVLTALNKFAPDLEELREAAASRPLSRFPIEYSYEPPNAILLPHLACIKGITTVSELRAVAELETHRSQEAFADVQLAFRLSDSIRDEPFLIDHLVRIGTLDIAVQGIREGIARHGWADSQLLDFETYLGKLDVLAEYEHAMRGERALEIGVIDYLRRRNGRFDSSAAASEASQAEPGSFYWVPSGWYYQNMCLVGEMYRDYLLPAVDDSGRVILPHLSGKMQDDLARRRLGPYNLYAKLSIAPLSGAPIRPARAQTWVDEARVACALERYRLEHHDLPDRLVALVPQFIPKVPNDLIDLLPLRYRKNPDGTYVLYSIGWNGVDDGGVAGLRTGSTPTAMLSQGDWIWKFPLK